METVPKLVDVSTQDLLDELMNRCSPAIFIGTKTDGFKQESNWWQTRGNKFVCYGLCHEIAMSIQASILKDKLLGIEEE
ncbi:MAG: hypothetical protein WC750_06090 [Patescibacteria group bacterium]|jgi:hypothetical protein